MHKAVKPVGPLPAEPEALGRSQGDRPDAGEEGAEPVAELVVRGAVRKLVVGQDLDPVGVDDDVLGRAEEGDDDRPEGEDSEMMGADR